MAHAVTIPSGVPPIPITKSLPVPGSAAMSDGATSPSEISLTRAPIHGNLVHNEPVPLHHTATTIVAIISTIVSPDCLFFMFNSIGLVERTSVTGLVTSLSQAR